MNIRPTFAYIDSQNLKKSVEQINRKIDYKRFRQYLSKKHNIDRAFMFFGYIDSQNDTYKYLEKCGFELVFRQVEKINGKRKSNIDICLTIKVLDQIEEFNTAFLISSDGDFWDLVERLKERKKFGGIISPQSSGSCSSLLKKSCGQEKLNFIPDLIHKFEIR